ncbi:DEAD/DEAH box helicase [Aerococcus sp. HMSC10H05]|uniref:DEAD/DEAH box helicase n=1 Tax=Aerococcus sp. HMSC10H05 TaxID=1581084 RepID=UPI0008A5AC0F|nr:helicase-related protein [Aerococcus sp. HMSC10H05]OFU48053.1 competence protein ComF [Aerococcus sp. HMSC10H05]
MEEIINLLSGRLVTAREIDQTDASIAALKIPGLQTFPAIEKSGSRLTCLRCGNRTNFHQNICQCDLVACFYCLQCLNFGKLRTCDKLYHLEETAKAHSWKRNQSYLAWTGTLSAQQAQASEEICQSYQAGGQRLVWAVTGAGKTEMVFEAVNQALMAGGKVALATPRIDVANELAPRFKAAFPEITIQLLHGQSEESYSDAALTIGSTHQLIRFKAAFDLLIIDEIDAFPYDGDPMLYFASDRAVKETGAQVLLTATPNPSHEKLINEGKMPVSILPARYHRHRLPVPVYRWVGDWQSLIQAGKVPIVFKRLLNQLLKKGRRVLIFMPNINLMLTFVKLCQPVFSDYRFASVSSKDPDRIRKVRQMRDGDYDFLFSTTILERGVTFANIDVIVLGSEDQTFTTAALVQISGRVGRKPKWPSGAVYFLHYGKTKASNAAIQQIKSMNNQARKRGLIDD